MKQIIHKSQKYPYIDALRGIAVLLVLLVHCSQNVMVYPKWFQYFINNGAKGVQLFYIVSALTLFISFNNNKYECNYYKKFFLKRFFRIAPLFYFAIIWYNFILQPIELTNINEFFRILSGFTFTLGFSPKWINRVTPGSWSIAVETTFYILIPLLFLFVKNLKHAVKLLLFTLFFSLFFNYILINNFNFNSSSVLQEYVYINFVSQMPYFISGIILYFLTIDQNSIFVLTRWEYIKFVVMLLIYEFFHYYLFGYFNITFIVLTGFIYLIYFYQFKIFVNKFICFIGKVSFSIYLMHFTTLFLLSKIRLTKLTEYITLNFFIKYILLFLISLAISYLTYLIIEKNGLKFGKKIINTIDK
ncbi:MAG: acyltransferase [Bacteroidetes bacterium]|nr:acyltransferase [Bacteroidota bacterium]